MDSKWLRKCVSIFTFTSLVLALLAVEPLSFAARHQLRSDLICRCPTGSNRWIPSTPPRKAIVAVPRYVGRAPLPFAPGLGLVCSTQPYCRVSRGFPLGVRRSQHCLLLHGMSLLHSLVAGSSIFPVVRLDTKPSAPPKLSNGPVHHRLHWSIYEQEIGNNRSPSQLTWCRYVE